MSDAREQLIEAMADSILFRHRHDGHSLFDGNVSDARDAAAAVLDAALKVRIPCTSCHGMGWVRHEEGSYMAGTPMSVPCLARCVDGYTAALKIGDEDGQP